MYTPSQEILDKYADVLVNFALNSGRGVKPGEVLLLQVPECAKPLLLSLRRSVLKAGAHTIIEYLPDETAREFYELANDDQLKHFPAKYLKGKVDEVDHSVAIIADTNKKELEGIPPEKLMARRSSFKKYIEWRDKKEYSGKFTWTLALYATPAMAKEAGLTIEEYWGQIIKACFLDQKYPIQKWVSVYESMEHIRGKLNSLKIKTLHIKAKDTDLTISMGKKRKWIGGSGRNIPSFELFTSPDWRGTEGIVSFNQPLYVYGNLVENIRLEFKDGVVVNAKAAKGQKVLTEMIKVPGADKIGEYSLTDSRFSRITKFMAETLYDENRGGAWGNTHLALGRSYHDCYKGDPAKVSKAEWKALGYNESVVHTDIISTTDRIVTATLTGGEKKVIYKKGKFTI